MAMDLSRNNTPLWRAFLRICLGLYVFYGIWRSATVDMPLLGFEAMIIYDRMASMWESASWTKLFGLPWWLIGTGAIPLYFFCIPFFLIFGANLFSLQLTALAWNLVGLWLIGRSIEGSRERFFAIALLTFGTTITTVGLLAASGTYSDVLLPFGIVVYVQRYFLSNSETMPRRHAAALSAAIAIVVGFMPTIFPGVLVLCILTVAGFSWVTKKRLLTSIVAGGAAGSMLMVPLLLAQFFPAESAHHDFPATPGSVLYSVIYSLPNVLELQGIKYSGYALAAVFYLLICSGLYAGKFSQSPRWASLLFSSAFFIFWLPMNTHFQPWTTEPDVFRFRQYMVPWPFWALFLAAGVEWLDEKGFNSRLLRGYQWLLLVTVCACVIAVFGALNWRAFGVTARMPLATAAGGAADKPVPRLDSPGDFRLIMKAPEEYRGTLAMLTPMSRVITANMGGMMGDFVDNIFRIDDLPPAYSEQYWTGVGLIACERTVRNSPYVESRLPEVKARLTAREAAWVDKGCDYGTRWRNGEIYLTDLGWPLEPRVIETGVARLWTDTARYRSREKPPQHRILRK